MLMHSRLDSFPSFITYFVTAFRPIIQLTDLVFFEKFSKEWGYWNILVSSTVLIRNPYIRITRMLNESNPKNAKAKHVSLFEKTTISLIASNENSNSLRLMTVFAAELTEVTSANSLEFLFEYMT